MRIKLAITLSLAICWNIISAQDNTRWLYNDVTEPEMITKRLLANKKWLHSNIIDLKSIDKIYVPLKFHLVANSEGEGRIDDSDVLNELCELNQQVSDSDIVFYIKNGFNELDNTPTYETPTSGTATAVMLNNMDPNAVNIFIAQNADTNGSKNGTTLGFYNPPTDYIVIRKSQVGTLTSTLAHEIGHYFSLRHPHYGWEDEPWTEEQFGKKVVQTTVSSSQSGFRKIKVELVDGSNCEEAADLLCDTPPDYNFGGLWPNSCPEFNIGVMDRNGDTIHPMINNFMSYFIGCEPYEFTASQRDVMIADYNSSERKNIRSEFVPDTNSITEELELVTPPFNETVPYYNEVLLEWSYVENASQYYLLIKSGVDEIRMTTSENKVELTTLLPNKTYTWTVHPYNLVGGCASTETSIFRTNDSSTAVADPEFVHDIILKPNPVGKGLYLHFSFYSNIRDETDLSVYDFIGRRLASYPVLIKSGQNQLTIPIIGIENGIYTLSIRIREKVLIRKFVVI